jgi:hypothetical protein
MTTESQKLLTTSQAQAPTWSDVPTPATTPDGARAAKWDQLIERLNTMMLLEDDWDGMGAEAPSREIILSAINLVEVFRSRGYPPPARVAPTPSATVGLEWQEPTVYLEVEVITPDRSVWMQIIEGMPPVHGVISGRPLIDPLKEGIPPVFWVSSGSGA